VHTLSGGCHCGNLRVELELTRPPESIHPRACDCDFCRKHAAAWISDREGSLKVTIADESHAVIYRQGSRQAELLLCGQCGVLVAALCRSEGRRYAAVNAKVLDCAADFGAEQSVSPQALSEREKLARWRDIWFCNVSIAASGV
jgi:hypothetical protein